MYYILLNMYHFELCVCKSFVGSSCIVSLPATRCRSAQVPYERGATLTWGGGSECARPTYSQGVWKVFSVIPWDTKLSTGVTRAQAASCAAEVRAVHGPRPSHHLIASILSRGSCRVPDASGAAKWGAACLQGLPRRGPRGTEHMRSQQQIIEIH